MFQSRRFGDNAKLFSEDTPSFFKGFDRGKHMEPHKYYITKVYPRSSDLPTTVNLVEEFPDVLITAIGGHLAPFHKISRNITVIHFRCFPAWFTNESLNLIHAIYPQDNLFQFTLTLVRNIVLIFLEVALYCG